MKTKPHQCSLHTLILFCTWILISLFLFFIFLAFYIAFHINTACKTPPIHNSTVYARISWASSWIYAYIKKHQFSRQLEHHLIWGEKRFSSQCNLLLLLVWCLNQTLIFHCNRRVNGFRLQVLWSRFVVVVII